VHRTFDSSFLPAFLFHFEFSPALYFYAQHIIPHTYQKYTNIHKPLTMQIQSSLTSGAFLLTFGKLADMFGRRILFILGMAGFTLSLLVAGFATNPIYMDVFSGIIGLFAAAVVPPAVGALGATYEKPSKRKNLAFACFSAGNPLGFVGGMIISGVAAHLYSWRASFWALAVVYSIFTGLTVWTVPDDGFERRRVSVEALREFDILGTGLVVVGFALFASSLSWVFLF
jgi:MFS family permease